MAIETDIKTKHTPFHVNAPLLFASTAEPSQMGTFMTCRLDMVMLLLEVHGWVLSALPSL